jgi:hypothetical protein
MEKIEDGDITVTLHAVDGFTLSYCTDEGGHYRKRYIGYGVKEAKRRFKEFVYKEDSKILRCMTREDVLIRALSCACGSLSAARDLLGNS